LERGSERQGHRPCFACGSYRHSGLTVQAPFGALQYKWVVMRFWIAVVLASGVGFAADESAAVTRARQELARVRELVAAGAIPSSKIAEAQMDLDDATDEAVLESTL